MRHSIHASLRRLLTASALVLSCSGHGAPPGSPIAFPAEAAAKPAGAPAPAAALFDDCHVHLTNYVQQGLTAREFLAVMANRVDRAALFGIPLQQTWAHGISGDYAPTYYLNSDAPLYYYSFTDAVIATEFRGLSAAQRARFDPMITGFNPADMYAVDHIRRVLQTFPGVFTGIGEFTIHKEFVSSKVAGEIASLTNPALDRIFDFAAETGLLVLIHSDADVPFAKPDAAPVYLDQMKALLRRHPRTTVVWAHTGLGRVVHPVQQHAAMLAGILEDPAFSHVSLDLSWDEVAKYVVASKESVEITRALVTRFPTRFLFGTDEVAPPDTKTYLRVFEQYAPFWQTLTPEVRELVLKGNYVRLFDEARRRVRAWEKSHAG